MRILRAGAALVNVGLLRHIPLSKADADIGERPLLRFFGDAHRIGTDVGNQTHGALANVDALVELLCNHHGTLCGKAQLARSLLLETACGKRRRGMPRFLPVFHLRSNKVCALNAA